MLFIDKSNTYTHNVELNQLIEQMKEVNGGYHKIITNNQNEIDGIFFQEQNMRSNFEKFPDVILFDCTYKLNDRRMPLGIMLVIDGNGESQVAGVFILRAESADIMSRLFEEFKAANPHYGLIRVILTDKSAANANAFKQAFPDANICLCIFHVQQIFNREITVKKRDITDEQRKQILLSLKRMIYTFSEEEYLAEYAKLEDMNCPGNLACKPFFQLDNNLNDPFYLR